MELERRIALFTSALVLGLLVCICVTLGGTILKYEETRLARDLKAVQVLFTQLEAEHFRSLEAETKLLADLPALRAVMTTNDAPTIVDALEGFRGLIHADFMDGFDEGSKPYDKKSRTALDVMVRQARATGLAQHGYVADGDHLKQAVAIPVKNGDRTMGTLVAGYRVGDDVLTRLRGMTRGEFALVGDGSKVFHATAVANEFIMSSKGGPAAVLKTLEPLEKEPGLRGEFMATVSPLSGSGGEIVARLVSLRALGEGMQMANRLRSNMIVLSTLFCFLAIAISFLFARSISKPLKQFSQRLAQVDPSDTDSLKRITESPDGIGADRDVQSLLTSFSQLVRALSREREHSDDSLAQRTQTLETDLDSLKLKNDKLADANRRLLNIIERSRRKDQGAA